MADAYDFFIAVTRQGPSEYVVKVNGEIDLRNAARLHEAILDGLLGTPNRLIINLAAVGSIDPSGLDVLVGAHRRATAAGTQLLLHHPSPEVAHLLERNGLGGVDAAVDSRSRDQRKTTDR
jgi:stage II sporulation protein AA (anti-sigma F factor antagonist)